MALKKKNKYWWGYSSYITHTIINCYNHWGKVWQFLKKLNRITTRPSNSLESSLGLQGDQTSPSSWIFTGRTDAEANAPILWLPDVKNWLIWKDPDAGKDWRQEEKGQQRMKRLDGITGLIDGITGLMDGISGLMHMNLSKLWEVMMDREGWCAAVHGVTGKDWRQEEKGTIEEETVGWHHWLDEHEFEQGPGVDDRQGSLECCCLWGCKELDTAEQLN